MFLSVPRLPTLSLPLAHRATAKEIHAGQQNDRSEQRHRERWQATVVLVNGASAKERRQQEPGQQSADHLNYNVEEYPLLRVCTHNEADDLSEDAANNEPQNEIHTLPLFCCVQRAFFLSWHPLPDCASALGNTSDVKVRSQASSPTPQGQTSDSPGLSGKTSAY